MGQDLTLVAYVTLVNDQSSINEEFLRRSLQASLPSNMIPAYFVILDQLPLTPNGKLDKKLLPIPSSNSQTKTKRAPTSANEIIICKLFEEVTGTQDIGLDDSFLLSEVTHYLQCV